MNSRALKAVVGLVALFAVLGAVAFWLIQRQRVQDEGNDLVVFNVEKAPVTVRIDGEERKLLPRETWRHRVGDGEHVVDISGADSVHLELGWERATVLVPTHPVGLAVIDRSAEYADMSKGRMMGRGVELEDVLAPAPSYKRKHHTYSPFEELPESTYGAVPRQTYVVPDESHRNLGAVRRGLEKRLGITLSER